MTPPLGTYSFLPWLRHGIADRITAADLDPEVELRATIRVNLRLTGEPVEGDAPLQTTIERDVQLYGPGDIVGIDPRAVLRTEPRHWITNHEPNHLAHVEFYDEDFPWRYTPAAPDASGLRLRPWLALVVLEQDTEFDEAAGAGARPLPAISVTDASGMPDAEQLWAWAHVHVNRDLAGSDAEFVSRDMDSVLPRLEGVLAESPDLAYSRIVCPRRLAANRPYHAFLVPAFESGRLAGLGLDPAGAPNATFSAWGDYAGKPSPSELPCYHRWYFHTGGKGDFEYLVRLLEPREVDARVGTRDIDVLDPGSNLPGITDVELGGVLRLGGALRAPRPGGPVGGDPHESWADPWPHPFQEALAELVNLADDYAASPAADANAASTTGAVGDDPDPIVTAPLYAGWHALARRLLRDRDGAPVSPDDNWVHELNLDPRHRVAAGFGTEVIQRHQEDYMRAAWEQVGDVLTANRRIRHAQLAKEVAWRWYAGQLRPLVANPARLLALTAPVQRRVATGGFTVHHLRRASLLAPVVTSPAMRRVMRAGSRLVRDLPAVAGGPLQGMIERVNDGRVSAAPPKVTPPGLATVDLAADLLAADGDGRADQLRDRSPWLGRLLAIVRWLLLALAALLRRSAGALRAARAAASALERLAERLRGAPAQGWEALREQHLTPEAVDALPLSPDFVVTAPGSGFTPSRGAGDSAEAVRFKAALRDWHSLVQATAAAGATPAPSALDLPAVAGAVATALDPDIAIPRRARAAIKLPPRIAAPLGEFFREVMAHPVIDQPMYEPLTDRAPDRFLPNLDLIPANSITLLETNQAFIEAYMVGLNHEFSRELLWREYPSDNRATCFRQFWDVRGQLDAGGEGEEQRRERQRDIPPLHRWRSSSSLGDHDHRQASGSSEELVLVIRGELLKKYPTAVIYAHHAAWQPLGGTPDPRRERALEPLTPAEADAPPPSKVRTPLYEAKVDPDIHFFGFDLTVEAAKGESGAGAGDEPGWFFVIQERPGEPRFGFDIERDPGEPLHTFNDLAWADAIPGGDPGDVLQAASLSRVTLRVPTGDDSEKRPQHDDDVLVARAPPSGARWAYVLYQAPVTVAVHAAEML